ncbi:replication-relaxation family protein [Paenibacillus illinoisensis]|uniref:replication-relaxation family protein n=1 Tax=Paenibacillus illinoisensis TaxID=59845 RepID=UPI001C8D5701|nr:replication-relaxation family protein [Paenibacillus illinoisensis]MBY0217955.1 replication-relaxation family protein [Paenibacillus illinoisensis]
MVTNSRVLQFEQSGPDLQTKQQSASLFQTVPPDMNPYGQDSPGDIGEMLLPDGSEFGLFSDPYAQQVFIKANEGIRNGQYWLDTRLSDGHFTEKEVKLLDLLSTIRIATRSQIHRSLNPGQEDDRSTVDFIKKCRKNGVICAFSWISPLVGAQQRKKPQVYALTKTGAQAAELIFQKRLPDKFWLQPIVFPPGRSPLMDNFFLDLAANELYSELVRIDRMVEWTRRPPIKIPNAQSNHYPYASFRVIKDANDFKLFWIEIFRPSRDWINKVITRFQRTELAFTSLPEHQRPTRVIIIVDGDSRVKILSELQRKYMPSVEVRYTTDERLLSGIGPETFINYHKEKESLIGVSIPYLKAGYKGMTASEYYANLQPDIEDDDDI